MIAAGKTVDPTSAAKMAELSALLDRIIEEIAARRRGDTVPSADTPYVPPNLQFRFPRGGGDYFVLIPPSGGNCTCGEHVDEPLAASLGYVGLNFGILPESK